MAFTRFRQEANEVGARTVLPKVFRGRVLVDMSRLARLTGYG